MAARISWLLIIMLTVSFLGWWLLLPRPVHLQETSFSKLPNWQSVDSRETLSALRNSCKLLLLRPDETEVGSSLISLQARDFKPACLALNALKTNHAEKVRIYFETYFKPVFFADKKPLSGLFTGYYVPLLKGSRVRSGKYRYPIYGKPSDLIIVKLGKFDASLDKQIIKGRLVKGELVPYPTRAEINQGAIKKSVQPILWVDSRVDRFFMEIQGSGLVRLTTGEIIHLGYASQNGHPYTAIGKYLIEKGVIARAEMSMQSIRQYLDTHPEELDDVLHQNASNVFFKVYKQTGAVGSEGVELTPGYSLAVDKSIVPYALPILLQTDLPGWQSRLMIAQDTGGAIKGHVRGDVFWGPGKAAAKMAGKMKAKGRYWLLLPKQVPIS